VEPLPGGLTNHNFKVTTSAASYVARISSQDTELLSIDRNAEYRNSRIAGLAGIAPEVADVLLDKGVLVVDWVEGTTCHAEDLDDPRTLAQLARLCRSLHSGERFVSNFDMFDVQRNYLAIVTERGFRLPPRYLDFMQSVARMRQALAVRAEPVVPCHNDLLAENLIDDGHRLWLIDFEYSGNNDAYFELGNIVSESNLSVDQLEYLLSHYGDRVERNKIARALLLATMAKYGWTLWASIQCGISELDFDFWSWGMQRYERAVAEFGSPDFDRLLDEVTAMD
jgi:thiamine kinase-like enzyme